jgi:hypothetical protein
MTTSTIYSTQIFTVTACPSTVSDCPARSTSTVTSVVPVGTTVCPKVTPTPSAGETEVVETPVSEITHTITETLTYTVGTGQNAHPTTTEITSVTTETVYATMTITKGTQASATPAGYPVGGGEEEITGTTTSTTTSTTTKYITVFPSPSAGANEGGQYTPGVPAPTGPAGGEGQGECLPPVTVTVTSQETVTVVSTLTALQT